MRLITKLGLITIGIMAGYVINVQAALISRTYTYTAGNTMTANENNTNENTLYNEFNGNIESANIKNGTIVNADVADTTLAITKLDSVTQSSWSWIAALSTYRRPNLKFISANLVDVENNTGTLNETCLLFPDVKKCVTEDTSSTNKYRRFDITATANFTSGTEDSGLQSGLTLGTSWYAIYAVKSQINTANFVLVGSTMPPTQVNFAGLNSAFQVNAWNYLGMIKYGDNSAAQTSIVDFVQAGSVFKFRGICTGNTFNIPGIRLATSSNAASITWTYAAGIGNIQIPNNVLMGWVSPASNDTTNATRVRNSSTSYDFAVGASGSTGIVFSPLFIYFTTDNIAVTAGAGNKFDLMLSGWVDGALGSVNPLF